MPRDNLVRWSYLSVTVPATLVTIGLALLMFMNITGLSLTTRLQNLQIMLILMFVVVFFIALLVGFGIGGWIWSRIAKRFLHVTREEMETFFQRSRMLHIGYIERANQRAIQKLYDSK